MANIYKHKATLIEMEEATLPKINNVLSIVDQ